MACCWLPDAITSSSATHRGVHTHHRHTIGTPSAHHRHTIGTPSATSTPPASGVPTLPPPRHHQHHHHHHPHLPRRRQCARGCWLTPAARCPLRPASGVLIQHSHQPAHLPPRRSHPVPSAREGPVATKRWLKTVSHSPPLVRNQPTNQPTNQPNLLYRSTCTCAVDGPYTCAVYVD